MLEQLLQDMKQLVRSGQLDQGMNKAIELIDKIKEALTQYQNTEVQDRFFQIFALIEEAIHNQDIVLLCDLLEYELIPLGSKG